MGFSLKERNAQLVRQPLLLVNGLEIARETRLNDGQEQTMLAL